MSICGKTFCQVAMLETSLDLLLDQLAREQRLAGLQAGQLTERAAFYLGERNTIHPLRDGNGRTQRDFIRTLGLRAGHKVLWAPISKFEMVNASKLSFTTNRPNALVYVIRKAIGLSH